MVLVMFSNISKYIIFIHRVYITSLFMIQLNSVFRVMLDMLSVQGNIDKKWDKKIEKAFWRGRDSRRERLKLIGIAREYPDLFNASLTNFFFYRHEEKYYGPKVPLVSFFKFFEVSICKLVL